MTFDPAQFRRFEGQSFEREAQVVLDAVGARFGAPPSAPPDGIDPEFVFHIARLNKVILFLPEEPQSWPASCAALPQRIAQTRLRVMMGNHAALRAGFEASQHLTEAGIAHLQFKGPLQQVALYGDPLRKPAGDIDLLVAPRDRHRARAVLERLGYRPTEAAMASWWSRFLSEVHLTRPGDRTVIDLHHGVQQPGLPRPHALQGFIDRREIMTFQGAACPVLSPGDRGLIAAISVAKAFLAHEPCLGALADLRASHAKNEPQDIDLIYENALRHGLAETLCFARHAADACFGTRLARHPSPLPDLTAQSLRDMLITPWKPGLPWPRRRRLLWALCGPSPLRYLREAGRSALSILYHGALQRQNRRANSEGSAG